MNDQTFKAIINWLADERKSGIPFKNKKYAPLIETEKKFLTAAHGPLFVTHTNISTKTRLSLISNF